MLRSFLLAGLVFVSAVGCDIGRGGGGDGKDDAQATGTGTGTGTGQSQDGKAKTDPKKGPETPPQPQGAEAPTEGLSSCALDGAIKLCFEYDRDVADTSSECVANQGTSSPEACEVADAVGVCAMKAPDGQTVRTYYYPPQGAADVKSTCDGANGVFSTP